MITKEKGELHLKEINNKKNYNKDNGGWVVLLFFFGKRIGCHGNEVIYSIVFLQQTLKG
jgi:hypothetical protein